MATPVLDYVPRLDPRNLAYRVTATTPGLEAHSVYWTGGVVLDQGQEGSCVGHGVVAEYLASPVRGHFARTSALSTEAAAAHVAAVSVYNRAKEIDEFEGVNYDGTSVRAGMLVGRERGWYTGFGWALNMAELRAGLQSGPVVIGIDVRESMFDPEPNGDWAVTGKSVGGHCCLITGYSPDYLGRGPRYRVRNSWGFDWGQTGNAYVTPGDLDEILFKSGGEAAVAVGRAL
jgi:hypothetical protein